MGIGQAATTIVPGDYPLLALIAWNRGPARPIAAQEAFALYEANWRHIDVNRMTAAEAALVESLARTFGHGEILARGRR